MSEANKNINTEQNTIFQFLKTWIEQQHHNLASLEVVDEDCLLHRPSKTAIYFGQLYPDEKALVSEQCCFLIEIDEEIDEILSNNILDEIIKNEGVIERSNF